MTAVPHGRLILRALALPAVAPFRAEYLKELAYACEQLGGSSRRSMRCRKALEAGCDGELDDYPSAGR